MNDPIRNLHTRLNVGTFSRPWSSGKRRIIQFACQLRERKVLKSWLKGAGNVMQNGFFLTWAIVGARSLLDRGSFAGLAPINGTGTIAGSSPLLQSLTASRRANWPCWPARPFSIHWKRRRTEWVKTCGNGIKLSSYAGKHFQGRKQANATQIQVTLLN